MRRAAAATMAALCLLTGCARTVPGQVAMTTTPLSPDMTCDEFVLLGDRDRVEVVGEILSTQGGGKIDQPGVSVVGAGRHPMQGSAASARQDHHRPDEDALTGRTLPNCPMSPNR